MAFAALASGLLVAEAWFAAEPDIISIRPAQVLDVRSGKLRRDVVVQIQGERILSVDSAREIEPSGARTIDLPGFTLLPGLIDAHTHLTYELADDWINQAVKESLADLALRGVRNARRTLMASFTTVRDLGAWDFSDVALARAVANGWIEGGEMRKARHTPEQIIAKLREPRRAHERIL
jgi:imidazolonepropionase-like amidohydrolase